jgi:predicted ribosomally synthesized peptide with nif11-like leader
MSADQFSVLLAKLQEDSGFMEKLSGVEDLDAALAIVNEAGFDLSKED